MSSQPEFDMTYATQLCLDVDALLSGASEFFHQQWSRPYDINPDAFDLCRTKEEKSAHAVRVRTQAWTLFVEFLVETATRVNKARGDLTVEIYTDLIDSLRTSYNQNREELQFNNGSHVYTSVDCPF